MGAGRILCPLVSPPVCPPPAAALPAWRCGSTLRPGAPCCRCPACQRFQPEYEKVAAYFAERGEQEPVITVARLDCASHVRAAAAVLCSREGLLPPCWQAGRMVLLRQIPGHIASHLLPRRCHVFGLSRPPSFRSSSHGLVTLHAGRHVQQVQGDRLPHHEAGQRC